MMSPKFTKRPAPAMTLAPSNGPTPSAKFTGWCLRLLPIALLPMLFAGCSRVVSVQPMPEPPANLAAPCPPLAAPPNPLIDPDRAIWESDLIAKYADCGTRHRLAVDAWRKSLRVR